MSRNSLGMTADALLRRSLLRRILCLGLGASSGWPQFCSAADNVGSGAEAVTDDDVLVVGSGIAGLCAAISAKESGEERVRILEKGPLIGGTVFTQADRLPPLRPSGLQQTQEGSVLSIRLRRLLPMHLQLAAASATARF